MADTRNADTSILSKAGMVWKFLDELSLKDPHRYKEFTQKVIKDGGNDLKPPSPKFSIRTTKDPEVVPALHYFINFIEWQQIPAGGKDAASIPLAVSKWRKETVRDCNAFVIDFAFRADMYHAFSGNRSRLIEIVLAYIMEHHHFSLSKDFLVLEENYSGSSDNLYNFLCPELHSAASHVCNVKETLIATKHLSSDDKTVKLPGKSQLEAHAQGELINSSHTCGTPLLTELATKRNTLSLRKQTSAAAAPPFEMVIDKTKETAQWNICLKGVSSVAECHLNVSKNGLHLAVGEKYRLKLDLPFSLDYDSTQAKFEKQSSSLVVISKLAL